MSYFSQEQFDQALRNCETEPIHQIGQIQPHGAILVLSSNSQRIVLQASNNLEEFFDLHVDDVCGKPLSELIGNKQAEQVEQLIRDANDNNVVTGVLKLTYGQVKSNLQARVFCSANMFVLELKRAVDMFQAKHLTDLLLPLQRSLMMLNTENDTYRYFGQIASIVRELTEFDRVMAYRFDANWEGEVIAESRVDAAHSYLGTHFPASDIPSQARQLYTSNPVRQIADTEAKPVPVLPALNPSTQQPLDMTYSALRSLSPVHVEYLRNMGVRASMSISLLQNGRLWGLIACHNITPKRVSNALLEAATFISQTVSAKLSLIEFHEQMNLGMKASRIIGDLLKTITTDSGGTVLQHLLPDLLVLLDASGVIMAVEGKHYVYGEVPEQGAIDALLAWLGTHHSASEIFSCDHLALHFAPADAYSNIASGLLASPLTTDMRNCIIWLRKEKVRTLRWAGKPEKYIFKDQIGEVRLAPRKSFETWDELWRGRCEPWSNVEIETASSIALGLTESLSQKIRLQQEQEKSKLANEAIRKYMSIVASSDDAIISKSLEGVIQTWNQGATKIFGYSAQEAVGQKMQMLIPPDRLNEEPEILGRISRGERIEHFETVRRHKDGRLLDISTTISPVLNDKGHVIGASKIARDITERKKAESILHKERDFTKAIFDTAGTLIVVLDRKGNIVQLNKAGELLTGYRFEEIREQPFWDIFLLESERAGVAEAFDRMKTGDIVSRYENHWRCKDGSARLFDWHNTVLLDDKGEIEFLIGIGNDITESRKLMDALVLSENEFRSLAESMPQIVWITQADGWNIFFNDQWVEYTGLSLEESYGHGWSKPFHPDDQRRAWDAWQNAVTNFGTYSLECRLRRVDGAYLWWLVRGVPVLDKNGKIIKWVGTCTDIEEIKQVENALKVSEERFRGAFETAAHGMALVSLDGKFIKVNKSLCTMLGYDNAELLATDFQMITHPADLSIDLNYMHQLLEGKIGSYQMEKRYFHKNRSIVWILLSVSLVRTSEGTPIHFVAQIQNITLSKAAEQELRIAAATFETHDAILITDADGFIIKVNQAFTTITGFSPEDVLGRNPRIMKSGRHDKSFYVEMFHKLQRDGTWEGEIWDKHKSGKIYPRWMTVTAIKDAQQKLVQYVSIFSDITDRKKNEELINKMAFYDPLTQLPNRRMLTDRLGQAMASNKRRGTYGAVMFMDLDKFKPLNDTHGHVVGDLLLIEVGQRISSCIREVDTVARFGGDEFVVMLVELNADEAKSKYEASNVAEKIRICLSETYFLKPQESDTTENCVEHNCSSSIGVTLFNGHEANQEVIFKQADTAMYRAKEGGRNSVRFYEVEKV